MKYEMGGRINRVDLLAIKRQAFIKLRLKKFLKNKT